MAKLIHKLFGTPNPLLSLTFWGAVLLTGLPQAVLTHFGVDVSVYLDALAPLLALIGIRRRLG